MIIHIILPLRNLFNQPKQTKTPNCRNIFGWKPYRKLLEIRSILYIMQIRMWNGPSMENKSIISHESFHVYPEKLPRTGLKLDVTLISILNIT